SLFVVGDWHDMPATIDGAFVAIADDGELQMGDLLATVGTHSVVVGGTRRSIEIVAPGISLSSSKAGPRDPARRSRLSRGNKASAARRSPRDALAIDL